MDIVGGFIGLGIVLAFAGFFAFFGGVETEDPIVHHSLKKSSSSRHKK